MTKRSSLRTRCAMILAAAVALSWACDVRAQVPGVWSVPVAQPNGVVMPMPLTLPISRSSKLALSVDTRWAQTYGYRPIEITVTSPNKPTAREHVITIQVHVDWNSTFTIEQTFKLPSGSKSATTSLLLPQFQATLPFLWWDVWVDGFKDRDLSLSKLDGARRMSGGYNNGTALSMLAMGSTSGTRALVAPDNMSFAVLSLAAKEFPKRWIEYTCFDVVSMTLDEARLLSQSQPESFEALCRWLRAGGQLWVSDVGNEFENIAELSKLLNLSKTVDLDIPPPAAEKAEPVSEVSAVTTAWRPLQFRDGRPVGQVMTFLDTRRGTTVTVRDPAEIARLQSNSNFVQTNRQFEEFERGRRRNWPADSKEWFVEQRLGLGSVRAFRGANEISNFLNTANLANPNATPSPDGSRMPRPLSVAVRSAGEWDERHGMTPDRANRDFPNMLVPNMGLAPVTEFRVLITLFVLLIGPLNYWLLKRSNQLHLMVLTVPIAAMLMTGTLFTYAVVSDGFGTTIRAHSLTTLDQRTGDAACWARLSYYSGLAPGNGLTMPTDVAMYPIIPGWNAGNIDAQLGAKREVTWTPDEAKLKRGWLRSRTSMQYLTVRSRKSPYRLDLVSPPGKMRATNKLGTRIKYLAVVDGENKTWTGEDINADAVAFLQPTDRAGATSRLRLLVTENAPQPPPELTGSGSHYGIMQQRQMFQARYDLNFGEQILANNLANQALHEFAGLDGSDGLRLPKRSYIAVTETGPEVEFGMDGAEEEASFHMLVGRW